MATKYAGTKTEKNLQEAFAGESQARNKYTYYASVAKKAGYEQMAALYLETADQEKEHAKMWFKELHGGKVGDDIAENLKDAAAGENFEWTDMYARMAREAREEGFEDLAVKFELVAKVEAAHEKRYKQAAGEPAKRQDLQGRRSSGLEVQELRLHPRRTGGSRCLSLLRPIPRPT